VIFVRFSSLSRLTLSREEEQSYVKLRRKRCMWQRYWRKSVYNKLICATDLKQRCRRYTILKSLVRYAE
jgi:hypothetical protein